MTKVGMRDLRLKTGEYVRLAGKGETPEITRRGRPVARLSRLPAPVREAESSGAEGDASRAALHEPNKGAA
jgi:antitoxin (DNA-binding transcriptional repressor) of toxin-antitoxin stability system